MKELDTNDELLVFRFGNGVKLIKPEKADHYKDYHLAYNTGFSVRDVLQLPLSFYFLNTQSVTEKINPEGALLCGYQSEIEAKGKSLFDVAHYQSAITLIKNCESVMIKNTIEIFDEVNIRKDTQTIPFLSVKAPWYDENNKIVGTYGCSIYLEKHPLANALNIVKQLGLLNHANHAHFLKMNTPLFSNDTYLSKREMDCLRLTIKGYTSKRIAQHLGISHRTVEEYLHKIKIKMHASSKSQLIEIAIDHFMQEKE